MLSITVDIICLELHISFWCVEKIYSIVHFCRRLLFKEVHEVYSELFENFRLRFASKNYREKMMEDIFRRFLEMSKPFISNCWRISGKPLTFSWENANKRQQQYKWISCIKCWFWLWINFFVLNYKFCKMSNINFDGQINSIFSIW